MLLRKWCPAVPRDTWINGLNCPIVLVIAGWLGTYLKSGFPVPEIYPKNGVNVIWKMILFVYPSKIIAKFDDFSKWSAPWKKHQIWQKFGEIWRASLFNIRSLHYSHEASSLQDSETRFSVTQPITCSSSSNALPCHCQSQIKETVDEWMVDANVPLLLLPQLNPSLLSKRSSPFIWLSSF